MTMRVMVRPVSGMWGDRGRCLGETGQDYHFILVLFVFWVSDFGGNLPINSN